MFNKNIVLACMVLISACAVSPERQAAIDAENAKINAFPVVNLDTEKNIVLGIKDVNYDGVGILTTNEDAIQHIKTQCMQTDANGIIINRVFDHMGVKTTLISRYEGNLTRAEGLCVKTVKLNAGIIPSLLSASDILNFSIVSSFIENEKIEPSFIPSITSSLKNILEGSADLAKKRLAFSRAELINKALLSKNIRFSTQINKEARTKLFPYLKRALVGSNEESLMAMEALYYNYHSSYFHDSMIAVAKYHPLEKMRIFASGYLAKLGNQIDIENLRNKEQSSQVRSYQGQLLLNAALLDNGKLSLFKKKS